jgi:hypothetical protein
MFPFGWVLCGDRGLLVAPSVRARGVVVADVLGDDALEVPSSSTTTWSRHSRRCERRNRSQTAFMFERIEGGPELVVAIAKQEPWRRTGGGFAFRSCSVTQACDGKRAMVMTVLYFPNKRYGVPGADAPLSMASRPLRSRSRQRLKEGSK